MMKRIWEWLKSIPVIGWIITGALFLLGLIGLRGRRDLGRPTPARDPEAIAAERKRIAADLTDDLTGIDAAHDRRVEESRDRWDRLKNR